MPKIVNEKLTELRKKKKSKKQKSSTLSPKTKKCLQLSDGGDDYNENDKEDFFQVINNKSAINDLKENYMMNQDDDQFLNDESKSKPTENLSRKRIEKLSKIKDRKQKSLPAKHPDTEERTIFIGNVNITVKRRDLQKFFSQYGKVENVRLRGIATATEKGSKKEAVIKNKFHPSRKSMIAYVRFFDVASKSKALQANGELFKGLHIRVDEAIPSKKSNRNTVFVGNLPWGVNDEDLWKMFEECGKVKAVRLIRSGSTGAGKGFGFVSFEDKESTENALKMNNKLLENRPIRVKKSMKKEKEKKFVKPSKKKSAAASLLASKKVANKSNLHFLKRDKPRNLLHKTRPSKKTRQNELQPTQKNKDHLPTLTSGFTGMKVVETGKKNKKHKLSKEERKKIAIAKQLTSSFKS